MAHKIIRGRKVATLQVRHLMARRAFRSGTFEASLVDESFSSLGTTKNHETWSTAAVAALDLAKRRGITVTNESVILQLIAEGK